MASVNWLRGSRGAIASALFQAIAASRYCPPKNKRPPAISRSLAAWGDFGSRFDSSTRIVSARLKSRRLRAASNSRRRAEASGRLERSRGRLDAGVSSGCTDGTWGGWDNEHAATRSTEIEKTILRIAAALQ